MVKLNYHQDPGHGWLEVEQNDLDDVGLSYIDFTSCSYANVDVLYLEEDCDMSLFIRAYKTKHGEGPELEEVLYNDECFIRSLPRLPV